MIPFPFNENQFSFFVADHLLVGQLCTNPKSDRSLYLSCLNSDTMFNEHDRWYPAVQTHALYQSKLCQQGPLPAPSKCKSGQLNAWGHSSIHRTTLWRWWSWGFKWGPHHATFTSLKSAWKSTPKCIWMYWRVWWSSGAIRWPVADPGSGSRTQHQPAIPKRPRLGFRLCTLLSLAPSSPDLTLLDYFAWSYVKNITNMTSHNTKASLIATIHWVFAKLPLVEKPCSQFWICIEAVIEDEGGYIE